ncbi:hypothetical protein BBOV_I004780 [Babesia bovis T2Bo]|uniref:Uncharacterized protein n=1 Tax=Babesia bovis TaxID=5865 RepID=A7AWY1_BABBO|nr:hypothetical protein BBOV_I004780 [Babesia bovis T2Bo]EDO05559.1 hypothetical protein BBOV_I004780 [Babesia bovis T2Bo]|eukprot:XP_001609127.1 hypothetical protein [Babesia bovis T2Bo]
MMLLVTCIVWLCVCLGLVSSQPLPNDAPEIIFKDRMATNLMRAKLQDHGLSVSFEDVDYLPNEMLANSDLNLCRRPMEKDYQDFLLAFCRYYACDIREFADTPIENLENRILYNLDTPVTDNQTHRDGTNLSVSCATAKIAARCSAYLAYAECVYRTYIHTNNFAKVVFQVPERAKVLDIHFVKYFERVKTSIPPLLDEGVTQLCRYVNTACVAIHPQFSKTSGFRRLSICSIFDVFTPITTFADLYSSTLESTELHALQSFDIEEYESMVTVPSEAVHSPLGIPYDKHINSPRILTAFYVELCNRRCRYVANMLDISSKWTMLNSFGRTRQLLICAKLLALCPDCPTCGNIDSLMADQSF